MTAEFTLGQNFRFPCPALLPFVTAHGEILFQAIQGQQVCAVQNTSACDVRSSFFISPLGRQNMKMDARGLAA